MELLRDDEDGWRAAADLLAEGRIVGIPTDTIYGVAAPVAAPGVVARLFPLKDRELGKPLAVLVADLNQARQLVEVSPLAEALAARWWPGALTIVMPRTERFDVYLGGAGDTVGVRCPAHHRVVELCRRLGPLATTSANRSGRPTPGAAADVASALEGTEVAAVLDGGDLVAAASTVVRVDGDEIEVLREGAVSARELAGVVAEADRFPRPEGTVAS